MEEAAAMAMEMAMEMTKEDAVGWQWAGMCTDWKDFGRTRLSQTIPFIILICGHPKSATTTTTITITAFVTPTHHLQCVSQVHCGEVLPSFQSPVPHKHGTPSRSPRTSAAVPFRWEEMFADGSFQTLPWALVSRCRATLLRSLLA